MSDMVRSEDVELPSLSRLSAKPAWTEHGGIAAMMGIAVAREAKCSGNVVTIDVAQLVEGVSSQSVGEVVRGILFANGKVTFTLQEGFRFEEGVIVTTKEVLN